MKNFASTRTEKAVEKPDGIFRTTLTYEESVMMCHFSMKRDSVIPLHNHPAVQIGFVVKGRIEFKRGDDSHVFVAEQGDSYLFGPNEYHGARALIDSEAVECFAPMRKEYV